MEKVRIQVMVEDAAGQAVPDAAVELKDVQGNGMRLARPAPAGPVEGQGMAPGRYELKVSGPRQRGWQPESRMVELAPGPNSVLVVLGKKGDPFYYADDVKVYFQPDPTSFLVVARGEGAAGRAPALLKRMNLETRPLPAILAPGAGQGRTGEQPADTSFLSVQLPAGQTVEQAGELMQKVAGELRQQGLQPVLALAVRRGERPVQGLTNELVVRFLDSVDRHEVDRIAKTYGLTVVRPVAWAGNAYVLARPTPSYDLLKVADELKQKHPVAYAEPNLLMQVEIDQFTPNDTLYANQTHLPLINCDDAWETLENINVNLRGGDPNITIAVFDPHGVAPNHPDLTANLTDGTSKLVTSFNFNAMAAQTVAGLGGDHGTQCAGTATAAFNNNLGVAGVAANCHLIGARIPSPATGIEMADAFIWSTGLPTGNPNPAFPAAPARAADVISNSWGVSWAALSGALRNCFNYLTVYGRGGRGCVVTFSTGNLGYVQFSAQRTFAAYARTIAVGASIGANPTNPVNSSQADPNGNFNNLATATDTRALYSPFGPEMDIVAPSHTAYAAGTGALIDPTTSTVRVGMGALDGCAGAPVCNDYAASFGGTSHASPTIAGAAALVLSVRPALSWVQVRRILRTTAVRIDGLQANAIGAWQDNDGDGINEFSQWYGYGRVDVNAAVIAARDLATAADIVVRENLADTGAVPSAGWHAHSPDIWVRRTDDPIPALAYSADPPHQSPRRGQDNYVYCRVKNVGTAASNEVYVRAMITHFPGFEFRYPQEFTPSNRPGEAVAIPMPTGTYLIGETLINNLAPGADQIVKMTWPQALIPPETVVMGSVTVTWHPCLLLEASPHDGPMPAGATFDIKRNNNIAQRNISILNPGDPAADAFQAVVAGTSHPEGVAALVIDRSRLAAGARVFLRLADPKLMEGLVAWVKEHGAGGEPAPIGTHCGVRLLTEAKLALECGEGNTLVITAPAGTRLEWLAGQAPGGRPALGLGTHRNQPVVEVGAGAGMATLPLQLPGNLFTPLLVAVDLAGAKEGELRLTQRRADGELSAGYSILVAAD